MSRVIHSTYAYQPANSKADLKVNTDTVALYSPPGELHIDPSLEWDIKQNGIKFPLQIRTNGLVGTLSDGSHRLKIALKLGIKKVPVQIVPDNFRKWTHSRSYGTPNLDPVLAEWVKENLWKHGEHTVTRQIIGGSSFSSIKATRWVRCECSCGASWKEEG
jgi:hypothetical protein